MAAAVDMNVTVTRGFFVSKESQHAYKPSASRAAADGSSGRPDAAVAVERTSTPSPAPPQAAASRRGEEGGARGLLSGLSSVTPTSVVPPPMSGSLPQTGSLTVGEHAHLTAGCKRLLKSVVRGLKACQEPEAASEGLGGTYFFMSELGVKVAIMKPCDEEPMAPNNPKGFVGRQLGEPGLKPTVRVGEAASREVAAYLLDHGHFARVPHTVMVKMEHPIFHVAAQPAAAQQPLDDDCASPSDDDCSPSGVPCKLGSLQEFVPHDCDTSEMGASRFAVRDVHRIGILDIRLLNTDRHGGNILVRRARAPAGGAGGGASALLDACGYELIPIDHGFALPEALEPPYFEWQHWPQAMMPFGREELEYIASLDAAADVAMLRREVPSLREESLRLLEVSTTLLKACAAAGLSLTEIAAVVTRPLIGMDEEPSELERICFAARAEVDEYYAEEAELTDLEEEEEGEGSTSDGPGMAGHLSGEEAQSPTFSTASDQSSAVSHFKMHSLSIPTASDASRLLDDAVFCMDEDGSKSPALAQSPGRQGLSLAARTGSSTAVGAAAPCTPAGAVLVSATSFPSPLSTSRDSLPASFESMSLGGGSALTAAGRAAAGPASPSAADAGLGTQPMSLASAGTPAFGGPSSYMPGFSDGRASQRPKQRRRRPAVGSRLRKRQPAEAYPPLVESRCPPAARIFSDMDNEQWSLFMDSVRQQVQAKLRAGAWKASAPTSGVGMSCPRF